MPTITIDGKEYDSEKMSQEALAQLNSIRVVDQEINRLQMQQAIAMTARNAYGKALQELLPK